MNGDVGDVAAFGRLRDLRGPIGTRDSGCGIRDPGTVLSKLAVIGIERAVFCWDIPWLSRSGHDDTSGMLSELRPR
jgi:hypothetical protein